MTNVKINLFPYSDRFVENSTLVLEKKVNFIFGKNGTGKSTIVKALKEQYCTDYDIHVFNGYEGIIGENDGLDAIALGTENAAIQKQIEEKGREIDVIQKELDENSQEENIAKKTLQAKKEYNEQEKKIDDFFQKAAKEIKEQTNPQIAKTNYDKNDFKDEI
jgi:chromosome segregation ATPase